MKKTIASVILAIAVSAVPAVAKDRVYMMEPANQAVQQSASVKAYMQAMEKMQKNMMMMRFTGNADMDFVQGMMAHHQGAIDMAKVELKYGRDPEMHKLAKMIIATQEREMKFMRDWMKEHTRR